jgi:hypothetical protein
MAADKATGDWAPKQMRVHADAWKKRELERDGLMVLSADDAEFLSRIFKGAGGGDDGHDRNFWSGLTQRLAAFAEARRKIEDA